MSDENTLFLTPQSWLYTFASLDDTSKIALIQMGIEVFMRAYTLNSTGLSTLRGAMFYVPKESNCLVDVMLHALNGSKIHRDNTASFFNDPRWAQLALAFK
jgi:hypothetical protein